MDVRNSQAGKHVSDKPRQGYIRADLIDLKAANTKIPKRRPRYYTYHPYFLS